jgi:hypothetical protein
MRKTDLVGGEAIPKKELITNSREIHFPRMEQCVKWNRLHVRRGKKGYVDL